MEPYRRHERTARITSLSLGVLILLFGTADWAPSASLAKPLVWLLHPVLLTLGWFCALSMSRRHREIEVERWAWVEDDRLTSGERRHAHKEAEAKRKRAAIWLMMAPVLAGAFFASLLREGGGVPADVLPLSALTGFGAGALILGGAAATRPEDASKLESSDSG